MSMLDNNLLHLIANLSQYKNEKAVLREFIELLNHFYPHLNIHFTEKSTNKEQEIEICTQENQFGFLRTKKEPEREEEVQITSATRMIAVILQNLRHNKILESEIEKRTCELKESEENLSITLNSIGDAVIATDKEGKVTRMNPVAEELTGWKFDDARGRNLEEVFHIINSKNREKVDNPVYSVLNTGKTVGLANHTKLIAKDQTEYQISDSGAPIKNDEGSITGVILVFRDVTKEYENQERIKNSEELLRAVMDSIQDGVSVLNKDLTIRYVNHSMNQWYASNTPLEGKKCYECYHNKKEACDPCPTLRALESGKLESEVVPGLEDGLAEMQWIELFSYPMKDEETGEITGIVEFVRDITERKKAGEALCESNKRLESFLQISQRITASAFNQSELMQAIVDNAVRAIDIDSAAIYLLQNKDKIRLEATFPALPSNFPEKFRLASLNEHPHIGEAAKSGRYVIIPDVHNATLTPAEQEIVRLRGLRSNLYIPILLRGQSIGVLILSSIDKVHDFSEEEISLLQNFGNQAAQIFDNVRNYEESKKYAEQLRQEITERKQTEEKLKQSEEKLKESEEHFKALFHQSSAALMLIDHETGDIIEVNNKAINFYGYTRNELYSMKIQQINTLPEEKIKQEMKKAWEDENNNFTFHHRLANGEIKNVQVYSTKITIKDKKYLYTSIHDITEQVRNRKRLQKGEEIAQIGHWEFDLNSNKVYSSEGARKIYGVKNNELTIAEVQQLPLKEYRPKLDEALRELIEKNVLYNVEFQIQRASDEKIIDIHSIAEYNKDRNVVFGIIQDISERKEIEKQLKQKNEELQAAEEGLRASNEDLREINQRLEEQKQELEEAKEKAEESDRLKSSFLANMSHEIRTPMNGIIGFCQILRENEFPVEEQKNYLDIINSRANHLLRLINDIVDISKIEADQLTLNYQDFSINDLLYELYNIYETELNNADKNHIDFKISLPEKNQNLSLHADVSRLRQVLDNLLKNAIKFTDEGKIELGYYLQSDQTPVFFVKDTGKGISGEYQEQIFQRFRQAGDSMGKSDEGTGLGLAISKNLIELMGGEIWVESTKGEGSTFFFTLPSKVNNTFKEEENEKEKEKQNTPYWEDKTILVVEDDPTSQEFIKVILKSTGAELLIKETGEDGLKVFNNTAGIDLILMDIRLPGMNGTEVIKKIREQNHDIPIIAQTAYAIGQDKEKCLQAGANDYIAKPINVKDLFAVIRKYIT